MATKDFGTQMLGHFLDRWTSQKRGLGKNTKTGRRTLEFLLDALAKTGIRLWINAREHDPRHLGQLTSKGRHSCLQSFAGFTWGKPYPTSNQHHGRREGMGNQSIEIKLQRQGLTEIIRPFNHNKVTGLFKTLVVRNDFLKDRTNPSTPYLFDEVRHSPGKGVLIGLGQVAMTTDEFDVLINNSHRSITDHRSEKADASPLSKG